MWHWEVGASQVRECFLRVRWAQPGSEGRGRDCESYGSLQGLLMLRGNGKGAAGPSPHVSLRTGGSSPARFGSCPGQPLLQPCSCVGAGAGQGPVTEEWIWRPGLPGPFCSLQLWDFWASFNSSLKSKCCRCIMHRVVVRVLCKS